MGVALFIVIGVALFITMGVALFIIMDVALLSICEVTSSGRWTKLETSESGVCGSQPRLVIGKVAKRDGRIPPRLAAVVVVVSGAPDVPCMLLSLAVVGVAVVVAVVVEVAMVAVVLDRSSLAARIAPAVLVR